MSSKIVINLNKRKLVLSIKEYKELMKSLLQDLAIATEDKQGLLLKDAARYFKTE